MPSCHFSHSLCTRPKTQDQHLSNSYGKKPETGRGTCPPCVHLLSGHVWPADGATGELHVPDKRLDRRLANQAHEEELRDEVGGHGSQGGQTEQKPAKALGLTRILHALVLSQSHLNFLLQALDVCRI